MLEALAHGRMDVVADDFHRAEEVLRKHEESYVLGRVRRDGSMVFGE